VGAYARVTAVRREDGALLALEITIERPPDRPPEVYEFQGILQSFNEAEWRVSDTVVRIAPDTVIQGTPTIGWPTWVRAIRSQGGPLVATHIRVTEPEVIVQFEGVIESLAATQWVVDGRAVMISANTAIEGTPEIGATAEIEAVQKTDGSLVARWIRVFARPTPSPTATRQPTATKIATTTPTATTAAPRGTPSVTAIATLNSPPSMVTATPKSARPSPTPRR